MFGSLVMSSQSEGLAIHGTSEWNVTTIRDMENGSTITFVAMPSLPATKPLGLYHSLEFFQTTLSSTLYAPLVMSAKVQYVKDDFMLEHDYVWEV